MTEEQIVIKGAKVNNLKNIDLTLPRNKFIVFTGLSGSGKSSLAFDTIYAEGQRRYVESLSSYARQFLGQMDKPDVEYIAGLSPSISIDQKTTSRNPRSTVGTVTEIYDYLRLLFSKIGEAYCPICGEKIQSQSIDQMVDQVMSLPEGTKIRILAPIIRGKKGSHVKLIDSIRKEGYLRMVIDEETFELSEKIELDKNKKHSLDVVVDRLIIRKNLGSRLAGSLESALALADGIVKVDIIGKEILLFNQKLACPNQHIALEEITPRMFSFNSPFGMCPDCNGLGFHKSIDPELLFQNMDLSIEEGGIDPYSSAKQGTYYYELFKALAVKHGFSISQPLKEAPKKFLDELLYGTKTPIRFKADSYFSDNRYFERKFEGIIENLTSRYENSSSEYVRDKLEDYMTERICDRCHGTRLKSEVLSIKICDQNIAQITDMSIKKALNWFENLKLTKVQELIGRLVLKEIIERLRFLDNVGLNYLTLSRMAATLSGGEAQRIRLATQIGSGLVGVVYVLDEPSIGLHQRDNAMLIKTLRHLTDMGNTLIVVEHDEDTMREADYLVDIGPGAGVHGGEVVAQGSIEDLISSQKSITGQYLSGQRKIYLPAERRKSKGEIELIGVSENNLKNINIKIPLGVFNCVTGYLQAIIRQIIPCRAVTMLKTANV